MSRKTQKHRLPVPRQTVVKHFSTFAPRSMALPRREKAIIAQDALGRPAWFLFDTLAFWELVCRLDERMFDKLSNENYESVSLGSLIDALEGHWPFNEEYRKKVQREYERALKEIRKGKMYSMV